MSSVGRRPMPEQWKAMMGNPGRRPLDLRASVFEPGVPECPAHLDEVARAEWARIVPLLDKARLITPAFRAIVAQYCVAWSRWTKAEEMIRFNATMDPSGGGLVSETKNGFSQFDHWFNVSNKAQEQLVKYAGLLCLTPVDSARAHALASQGDLFGDDPLAAMQEAREKVASAS